MLLATPVPPIVARFFFPCAALMLAAVCTTAQPLDPDFNPNASADIFAVTSQADGKILIGGNFLNVAGSARAYLARLQVDGRIDSSFNPGANTTVSALAVQPDGRIVVGGSFTTIAGSPRVRLARLTADGGIDPTFNAGADTSVLVVTLQPDGKILIGGIFGLVNNAPRTVLARLNADGSLDATFSPLFSTSAGTQLRIDAITLQPDGRILVGGSFTTINGTARAGLARLAADGSLDATFNIGSGVGFAGQSVGAIVVQADGRVLLGGSFTTFAGATRSRLARVSATGTLDEQVGVIGPSSIVRDIVLQSDGKFLVGGAFNAVGSDSCNNLARFNADGSFDASFQIDVVGANGVSAPGITELHSPTPGQVIIGGTFSSVAGQPRNGLARLGSPPPVIATSPRGQTLATGQAAELSVAALGLGLSYQWHRNGAPISGATNSTILLASATAADSGSYTVTVTNQFGRVTSSAAAITIESRTVYILQPPTSRAIASGTDLTLSVVAGGRPAPTYQWFKDGQPITGATGSSLVLGWALPAHTGAYTVVVTDPSGSLTTPAALVSVSGDIPYLVSTLAGRLGQPGSSDGPPGIGQFFSLSELTVDGAGYIYASDREANVIRKISPAGIVTTLAGSPGVPGFVDGPGANARFNLPTGIAVDRAGNVFVADTGNNRIRKITPAGMVTTFAGGVQGNVDGVGTAARFGLPHGLTIDPAGNLYCTETLNHTVRRISPAGVVTLVAGLAQTIGRVDGPGTAARFTNPRGIVADPGGNLYVADMNNHTIRHITADGSVTTFAGEPGTSLVRDGPLATARFTFPQRLALDAAGNLFVVSGFTLRRIGPDGVVTTQLGSGTTPEFRDGIGTTARFSVIMGVATDTLGSLYLSDRTNAVIRKATPLGRAGARLANLSVRSLAGTGGDTLIVGFNISGSTSSLLIRAVGPTLAALGVGGVLADPSVQLEGGGTVVAQNNDWDSVVEGVTIRAAAAGVGAFALPAQSKDAALLQSLAAGSFTAQVGGGTGVTLVEVYDLPRTGSGRLANVSARTRAGTGADTLIVGFVVAGDAPQTVLIRGVGPTLGAFGVGGALATPRLELYRDSLPVETNNAWGGSPALTAAFGQVGAFALPADSRDSALLVTLLPGAYTAQLTGANDTTGIALVEIYEVR